jgi:hypothetical protein
MGLFFCPGGTVAIVHKIFKKEEFPYLPTDLAENLVNTHYSSPPRLKKKYKNNNSINFNMVTHRYIAHAIYSKILVGNSLFQIIGPPSRSAARSLKSKPT